MVVGVCTLELHLSFCHSLKDKRRIIKGLKDRLRGRHNISLAEVDGQDTWQRSVIAIAAVADSRPPLETLFQVILSEVESHIPGDVTGSGVEYL